jgi:hypothetical protein
LQPDIFLGALADGSVRALKMSMEPDDFKALTTVSGSEHVDRNAL